jgi:glutamate/tyrosine decarboxylase-like PLP-dependent enzyme
MSLKSVFALAAQRATAYRDAIDEAAPPRGYAEMRDAFDAPTPEQGKSASVVIEELVALSTPGLRAMTGPRFFGWVIGASHPAGVAADWLTSAWGQNAGNHEASPAAAAVEAVAAKWLLDLLDLPREASVGFVTGATVANFVCLAAARGAVLRRVGWDVEADGLFGAPPIRVLIGDDAHTSVFSALQFLGLGRDRVVRVATDCQGRMLPAAFTRAMADANGPAIAIIQAGQINTGAFDPIEAILPEVRARNVWAHVDGAFGLWARACAATADLASGYELADSWRSTDTNGCRRPMTAAMPSCGMRRRIAGR